MSTKYDLRTVADGASDAWDTAPESHKKILRDCADSLMQAADEIERLPKTRNGAIIVLGKTELWARDDYSDPPLVFRLGVAISLSVGVAMGPPKVMADCSSFVDCDQTYSTREAAEKARKE